MSRPVRTCAGASVKRVASASVSSMSHTIPPPIPIADLDNRQRLHPDKVAAIMAMGFSREEAIVALNWETGNLQRALLYLLGE